MSTSAVYVCLHTDKKNYVCIEKFHNSLENVLLFPGEHSVSACWLLHALLLTSRLRQPHAARHASRATWAAPPVTAN